MGRHANAVREREVHEYAYDRPRGDGPSAHRDRQRPMFISDVALRADGVATGDGAYDTGEADEDDVTLVAPKARVHASLRAPARPLGAVVLTDGGTLMMPPPARQEPRMPLAPISAVHTRPATPAIRRGAPRASSLPTLVTIALLAAGALVGAILGATEPIQERAATAATATPGEVEAQTVLELPATPVAAVEAAVVEAVIVEAAVVEAAAVETVHAPAAPAAKAAPEMRRDAARVPSPRAAAPTRAKSLEETLAELGEQQLLR